MSQANARTNCLLIFKAAAWHVPHVVDIRNVYEIFVSKSERNRPLRRPRCWSEDNIKINVKKIRGRVWTGFIWVRIRSSGDLLKKPQ